MTAAIVVLGLVVNSLAGFALSRMRWRGRKIVLIVVIATLIVPFETIAIPMVYWVSKLPWIVFDGAVPLWDEGWLNTYRVQILPFVANAFSIFLFAQYFGTIPKELDEAARVDGCGWFGIFRRIIAPLSGPAYATVAILTFLPAWNSYLWPLMVVQKEELRPVMVGLQYFFQVNPAWGEIMAYSTLITIPVLAVFLTFQRAFVSSIASSGMKGQHPMLSLPDHWVWDSWIADDGDTYHLFFLRASRSLIDPDRRHLRASIGHATSDNLRDWQVCPDALVHADSPAWDDQATWTGSVVRGDDGRWRLFYTGVDRADRGLVQRVGVAVSDDLHTWTRVGDGPLLEADPRWYEKLDLEAWHDEAWRDPFVFRDPDGDGWHMLLTARVPHGDAAGRGVIGHAHSKDLDTWEIRPPLSVPAGFGQLEVAQAHVVEGQPLLVFSCWPEQMDAVRRDSATRGEDNRRVGGVWTVPGESLLGPWDFSRARVLEHPTAYAGQLIQDRAGTWYLHAFADAPGPQFQGLVLDPMPVRLTSRGLELAVPVTTN